MDDFSAALPRPVNGMVRVLSIFLTVVGAGAFLLSAKGDTASRAWGMLLVSTMFFLGISMAGVVIAAVLKVAVGNWGRSISRIAESLFAFAPVAAGLVAVIHLFGAKHIYPWATEKVHQGAWLTFPNVFIRDMLILAVLLALGYRFVKTATAPDAIVLRKKLTPAQATSDSEVQAALAREASTHRWLSPVFILCWAIGMSFIAFDMIMSIDPEWTSALFGAWFFMTTLYTGWATTWALSAITNADGRLSKWITPGTYHDLGKFTFSWCMAWMYLLWCQYLPYWYGNMPEETHYWMLRSRGVYEHLAFATHRVFCDSVLRHADQEGENHAGDHAVFHCRDLDWRLDAALHGNRAVALALEDSVRSAGSRHSAGRVRFVCDDGVDVPLQAPGDAIGQSARHRAPQPRGCGTRTRAGARLETPALRAPIHRRAPFTTDGAHRGCLDPGRLPA